jgi:hypothetical protein
MLYYQLHIQAKLIIYYFTNDLNNLKTCVKSENEREKLEFFIFKVLMFNKIKEWERNFYFFVCKYS